MKTNDKIAKDNRKALKPFLLIMLLSLIVGALLGAGIVSVMWINGELLLQDVFYMAYGPISGWLTLAVQAVGLPLSLHFYRGAKKILAGWDGEDEEAYQQADHSLSCGMMVSCVTQVLTFLLMGASVGIMYDEIQMLAAAGGMLFMLVWVVRYQQKSVDLIRRANPEKEGSVYDVKFMKKWLASCDEAERQQIGEASAFAFQKVNGLICPILWCVMFLISMIFDCGPMPTVAVCLVWLSLTVTYQWKAIQLGRSKGAAGSDALS